MVVITISYPHQPRFNYHSASSTSASPTLTDSGSEPLPSLLQVSSDGDTIAATKQEEWVKKKKLELTTTKQIETRVKRQVVLEDGKVVDDSGPIVTTNTTEDTDKQESEHTEHFTHGDDLDGKEGWVAVDSVPEDAVVKETNEKKITTHDEVEDIYETEEIQHLGDVSNEALVRALRDAQDDTKGLLSPSEKKELLPFYNKNPQKRVLQQSRRHDRTTDIEDTKEVTKKKEDGNLVTEITRRHEHEEFHNDDLPDSGSDESEHIENHVGEQDYSHGKTENFVEYLAVPKGSGPRAGFKIGESGRTVSENITATRHGDDDLWDSVSERLRRNKAGQLYSNKYGATTQVRPNVLTNRPLDMGNEEYVKRHETNRWLNSHFGSSSSSLNSETSPRSPLAATPTGIHVTMTSRNSPLNSPPPGIHNPKSTKFFSKTEKEPVTKRISFGDTPSRQSHQPHSVRFDSRNMHTESRSVNSSSGRASMPKSGSPWDVHQPTPTPPPRYRRTKSPDHRADYSPDEYSPVLKHGGAMNRYSGRHFSSDTPSYLQKREDIGERKSYERREQNFEYNGPPGSNGLTRGSLESGNYGDYVTKHSNFYKTHETDNPTQNSMYENGEAEVEQRKTVERRERVFSYDGPSQKQFQSKYILGTPSSTIGRLKGIEHTGAITEAERSQSLPRRRFYFGDEQGSLSGTGRRHGGATRALKYGADDINVSISNSFSNASDNRKSQSLNRSMSFTPRSQLREKPSFSSRLSSSYKHTPTYASNPQLLDSPDLLAPKLLQSMSRSVRDINSLSRDRDDYSYSNQYESKSRAKSSFLDSSRKTNDYYDRHLKAESPARSINSPTNAYSRPLGSRKSLGVSHKYGGASSPVSDDYQEMYRMSNSTPDNEEGKPRISTDTTSKFSRRTLRSESGEPAGHVESSETTTRTKSRFTESGVMYPASRRVASPSSFQTNYHPRQLNSGTVVIPVRDGHSSRESRYRK